MQKILKQIELKLKQEARQRPKALPNYFNSELILDGYIPVPKQRLIFKQDFENLDATFSQQKKLWKYVWQNSNHFLVRNQSLFFLDNHKKNFKNSDWAYLKSFVTGIDNWAHADALANIYAVMHEKYPKKVRPDLKPVSYTHLTLPTKRIV